MFKKLFLFFGIFISGAFFLLNSSPTFATTWTKYENNPVLELGPPGSWDSVHVSNPFVLFDGTIYKMWYQGYGSLDGVTTWRIGYATSSDGKTWSKYEGNPVLKPNPTNPNEKSASRPAVLFNGQNYEMWYTSSPDGKSNFKLAYATSSNGINWVHYSDFVLTPSAPWEIQGIAAPFILKDGTMYKMWYSAKDNSGIWRVGYATSPDGKNWSKYAQNPVLEPVTPWEQQAVVLPWVIKNSVYEIWYHAGPKVPIIIAYATSTNGLDWSKPEDKNPVFQRGFNGSFDDFYIGGPSVLKRGDVYQMWYGGYDGAHWRIGYASTGEIPPPPPEKSPIVLLPGLGASWNHQKIFLGEEVAQSDWKMTPFVKVYDNLLATLEAAGYVKNQDLFVFNYDWTKPINIIADDFENYLDSVVDPPAGESSGKKIKLIGHSLGGLVARAYVQKYPGNHNIEQLITLGSPHKGVPQVYKAWEGADLHDLLSEPLRTGAELLLTLRGGGYKNRVLAIQALVPSLKDLLFIEDYLKHRRSGRIIPESSYSQQNFWLKNLGISTELLNLLATIVGKIGDTPRWLKVIPPSKLDKLFNRWEDGKPVDEEFEIGDKTVLATSATIEGALTREVSLNHSDLIRTYEGIKIVLALLGMESVSAVVNPYPSDSPFLVFALASPGNLRITNPLGEKAGFDISPPTIPHALFLPQEKMVVVPGAIDGLYKIEIVGNQEAGSYRLLIGQLTEKGDIWSEYQDKISSEEIKTYKIEIDNTLEKTDLYLAGLINLKLKQFLNAIKKEKIPLVKKIKTTGKVLKIQGKFKPVPLLIKLKKDKAAKKLIKKALFDSFELIDYLEKNKLASLLDQAKEIRDYLDQLYLLL